MDSPQYKITAEQDPISLINPLARNVSPPRKVMMGGNLTQTNIVRGATRKRLRSGLEREHAKGTIKHMFDHDAVVLAVIPKFAGKYLEKGATNPMDLVIYEDYNTRQLCCIEMYKYHVMHQHYGFNYKFKPEIMDSLGPGARFEKGTVIADSPNVTPDGDYMIGLEAVVAHVTDPSVSEDALVFSESYARAIRTSGFESRMFTCGRTHYPNNTYGTPALFKAFPDIGEIIHSNGMLAALRPFDPILDPIYMTSRNLMTPCYGMDVPLFGIAGAKVVDISVLHNGRSEDKMLPPEFTRQLRHYHEAEKEYYLRVIKEVMMRTGGKKLSDVVNLHPDLWRIIYEGICYVGDELVRLGWWPKEDVERLQLQRGYRGELLDEWRVEITFEYITEIAEGPKATNLSGSLLH